MSIAATASLSKVAASDTTAEDLEVISQSQSIIEDDVHIVPPTPMEVDQENATQVLEPKDASRKIPPVAPTDLAFGGEEISAGNLLLELMRHGRGRYFSGVYHP